MKRLLLAFTILAFACPCVFAQNQKNKKDQDKLAQTGDWIQKQKDAADRKTSKSKGGGKGNAAITVTIEDLEDAVLDADGYPLSGKIGIPRKLIRMFPASYLMYRTADVYFAIGPSGEGECRTNVYIDNNASFTTPAIVNPISNPAYAQGNVEYTLYFYFWDNYEYAELRDQGKFCKDAGVQYAEVTTTGQHNFRSMFVKAAIQHEKEEYGLPLVTGKNITFDWAMSGVAASIPGSGMSIKITGGGKTETCSIPGIVTNRRFYEKQQCKLPDGGEGEYVLDITAVDGSNTGFPESTTWGKKLYANETYKFWAKKSGGGGDDDDDPDDPEDPNNPVNRDFVCYPNPVNKGGTFRCKDFFKEGEELESVHIQVFDMQGRIVKDLADVAVNENKFAIKGLSMADGIYGVRIKGEGKILKTPRPIKVMIK